MDTGGGKAGAAARKGFTASERRAFLHGRAVLWKDGGRWHPGVVVSLNKDVTGRDYATIRNTGPATKNVAAGETTRAYPGGIKKG